MSRLLAERQVLDTQIDAIKRLISPRSLSNSNDKARKNGSITELSLSKAIAHVIKSYDMSMKPKQVADELERYGFKVGVKTPLSERVANEMWKMARRGILKRYAGKYHLKQ